MLLYDHSRAFEYLVNFELVDLVGILSQMEIHLFIERGARQCIPRPARRAIGLPSLSLILFYLLIYLGLKGRKVCGLWGYPEISICSPPQIRNSCRVRGLYPEQWQQIPAKSYLMFLGS